MELFAKVYSYFSKLLKEIVNNEQALTNGQNPSADISMFLFLFLFFYCNNIFFNSYLIKKNHHKEVPTEYVQICFNALHRTSTTTRHIAGLIETTKLIVNRIISIYQKNGETSNGYLSNCFKIM